MKIILVVSVFFIFFGCGEKVVPKINWNVPVDRKDQYIKKLHECIKSKKPNNEHEWERARKSCEVMIGEVYGEPVKGFIYVSRYDGKATSHFVPCKNAVTEEEKRVCGSKNRETNDQIIYEIEE